VHPFSLDIHRCEIQKHYTVSKLVLTKMRPILERRKLPRLRVDTKRRRAHAEARAKKVERTTGRSVSPIPPPPRNPLREVVPEPSCRSTLVDTQERLAKSIDNVSSQEPAMRSITGCKKPEEGRDLEFYQGTVEKAVEELGNSHPFSKDSFGSREGLSCPQPE